MTPPPELGSRLSTGPFWQMVQPSMVPGEVALHMAHLRCARAGDETNGSLFLTSRQILWRTSEGLTPGASDFDLLFTAIVAVEQDERLMSLEAFRVVTEVPARPLAPWELAIGREQPAPRRILTEFFPQHRTDADRLLCRQMHRLLEPAWQTKRSLNKLA